MNAADGRIRAAAADRAGASIAFLRALVEAQAQGEAVVQARVADGLRAAGAAVRTLRYRPAEVPLIDEFAATPPPGERESVLGTLPGTGEGRSLILFAHPDSEPFREPHAWSIDPFAGVIRDGRLHGWGVADDLSGVAILVSALDVLQAAGVRTQGTVTVASTPSKRHARGVHAVLHHGHCADAAVYLHPAESGAGMREVKAVSCGQLEFRITVSGRAPDTSEPGQTVFAHTAVNAIDKAWVLCAALRALDDRRAARVRHAALEAAIGRSTNLMIASIAAGQGTSRVPQACVLLGTLSFPPGEALDAVRAELIDAIATTAAADPWLREHPPVVECLSGVTGAEVPPWHPLLRTTAAVILSQTGVEPVINPLHAASDIRNPIVQKGIPCVGLGPRGGNLTQNGCTAEWVDIADHLRAVAMVTALIAAWCGTR